MDPDLVTAIVGSGAGVAAAVLAAIQVRQGRSRKERIASPPELLRSLPDLADPPPSLAPPLGKLPKFVVGREALIAPLLANFDAQRPGVHILHGLGGIGKSTIALKVADEAIAKGFRCYWVSASNSTTFQRSIELLARERLMINDSDVDEALEGRRNLADMIFQQLETGGKWLLIFDNADDPEVLGYGDGQVNSGTGWLRPSSNGLLLVTSRVDRDWGMQTFKYRVPTLTNEQGAEVLLALAPGAGSHDEALLLADRLANLPLALFQAGSHISSPLVQQSSFASYHKALGTSFAQLLGATEGRGDVETQMRMAVTTTWQLSLDSLENAGIAGSRRLLEVLSCFADSPIPPELVLATCIRPPRIIAIPHFPIRGEEPFRLISTVADLKRRLIGLHSVGLIAQMDRSGNREDLNVSVQLHPLVGETVWRGVHHIDGRNRKLKLRRADIAQTASSSAALASKLLFAHLDDELEAAERVDDLYEHLVGLMFWETPFLRNIERGDLVVAAISIFRPLLFGRHGDRVDVLMQAVEYCSRWMGADSGSVILRINQSARGDTLHNRTGEEIDEVLRSGS